MLCCFAVEDLPGESAAPRVDDCGDRFPVMSAGIGDRFQGGNTNQWSVEAEGQSLGHTHANSQGIESSRSGGDGYRTEVFDRDPASLQLMIDFVEQQHGMISA